MNFETKTIIFVALIYVIVLVLKSNKHEEE